MTPVLAVTAIHAAGPANLGGGLRELLGKQPAASAHAISPTNESGTTVAKAAASSSPFSGLARTDKQGRYLVNIYLKKFAGAAAVTADLKARGAAITATSTRIKTGAIAAFIPLTQVAAIAQNSNVKAVSLVHRPITHVGAVTSEGAAALHTQLLNLKGFTGKGITVGILSDSFDTSGGPINAAADVASGDLPGPGNPLGHTTPVVLFDEGPAATDEGRGMAQIVHDLAPDAKLCFASAFYGELSFAANIVGLADPTLGCGANIIVDDVGYSDEPVFSDGFIAQAANTVAAAGIAYFSAAGNANQNAYEADFRPVADTTARAGLGNNNLHLDQVPASLTAGGFHNFAGAAGTQIAMPITTGGNDYAILQWNDPFFQGAVTADYAVLLFDMDGNFLGDNSTFDNTFLTDQPIQEAFVPAPSASYPSGAYQIVLAKMNPGISPATRLHLGYFYGNIAAHAFTDSLVPTTYGHPTAAGAMGVAATYWGDTKSIEYFSSLGPTRIYFDSEGNRLATPIMRKKPDIAAVDGVSTTFFGQDVGTGFPVFFGTSAAAPHAAGVAAVLMQIAGGPGAISGAALRNVLQKSSHKHDLQPGYIEARNQAGGLAVRMTGTGYIRLDPTKFTLGFTDTQGKNRTLTAFHLDLTNAGLFVRGSFAVSNFGPIAPTDVSVTTAAFPSNTLDLSFANSTFTSGGQMTFGFRFNEASIGLLGRNVDLLAGSTFAATFSDGSIVRGTFANLTGSGYTVDQGFGLIDAEAAAAVISPAFLAAPVKAGSQ